jgi:DUF1680 family protein
MPISRRHATRRQALVALAVLGLVPARARAALRQQPAARGARALRVPAVQPGAAELLSPSAVQLGGWLGARVALNASVRLLTVDTAPLLAGFKHKPGSHPWIGEHVGKWLHAATLAWSNTGDKALRAKLDGVVRELIAAQEPDGYLGTYEPAKRLALFDGADWDVWSHKYCLIGLLTYHQYTGHAGALRASRKAADLLMATFPAQRSILAAGTHEGMAATSVLEPVVLLYRITGEPRYLQFARYIVRSWDEPKGPGIVKSLLRGLPVTQVSNGKAYEMLSNLVGLCELARATGEPALVQAVQNAWADVVGQRLYVTGSTSQFEHFQADRDMRDTVDYHVGETCVTTTWIQLNLALLQLTGEARFGDELERSFYNHLTAAQHPAGDDWCYYTALDGRKQYDKGITCCHSSGPRGLALAPQAAFLRGHARGTAGADVLLVNTLDTASATLVLGGQNVSVQLDSGFPHKGEARLTLRLANAARFAVKLRAPAWAQPLVLPGATVQAGWAEVPARLWQDGDQIALRFNLASRVLSGETTTTHKGRAALAWGPFVLAYEQQANPGLPPARKLGLVRVSRAVVAAPVAGGPLRFEAAVDVPEATAAADAASPPGVPSAPAAPTSPTAPTSHTQPAHFLTFADAGATQGAYRVWLRAPGVALAPPRPSASLLASGEESRSRSGNVAGSINDDDLHNLVNTWNGAYGSEDWFAVTLEQPATASRFVFTHGRNYHDGGWFDTQAGAPLVQVQRSVGAVWQTIGELGDYPATTATHAASLVQGQQATLQLAAPVQFVAVRVVGKPSSGDRAEQAFVTCSELQAFAQ